ncbi:MAG TPA: type II secretion system protein GspG [Pyrinomonadaceae bacterium]|jgi:hypothetical protein|nr:type II secretion system protein GspG [Pyrinomonadaceae bacterium]
MKVEGRKLTRVKGRRAALALVFFVFASPAFAQKKPKPALKEKAARDVIAATTPGFVLKKGAVKVREVSPAGSEPVTVVAEVTEAFRFASVEDERATQDSLLFKQKRWRAVEFRTGDRSWEEFDFLAAPLGAGRVEAARRALEELVTEFEARQGDKDEKDADKNEPLTRGPLTMKQLSPMGSSAVAEVAVEATFRLARDARGKWRVSEVLIGGESLGDAASALRSVDAQKAERARAEMRDVASALEAFRRERGFYVVAEDAAALMDHLSPRHIKTIVRIDPWHRAYRYAGTREQFTLSSDGPDGKPGTPDDVTYAR